MPRLAQVLRTVSLWAQRYLATLSVADKLNKLAAVRSVRTLTMRATGQLVPI